MSRTASSRLRSTRRTLRPSSRKGSTLSRHRPSRSRSRSRSKSFRLDPARSLPSRLRHRVRPSLRPPRSLRHPSTCTPCNRTGRGLRYLRTLIRDRIRATGPRSGRSRSSNHSSRSRSRPSACRCPRPTEGSPTLPSKRRRTPTGALRTASASSSRRRRCCSRPADRSPVKPMSHHSSRRSTPHGWGRSTSRVRD